MQLIQERKQAIAHRQTQKRIQVRYSNSIKCLICYLICFSLPIIWQGVALWQLYPYKLAATAPNIVGNLYSAFPFLKTMLLAALDSSQITASMSPSAIAAAISYRDSLWQIFVLVLFLVAWLATFALQLFWRFTNSRQIFAARTIDRAVNRYHLSQLIIIGINIAIAGLLLLIGVRFIEEKTHWDYLVYFLAYPMNIVAAFLCFRLAAPPVISGKRAFFRRL